MNPAATITLTIAVTLLVVLTGAIYWYKRQIHLLGLATWNERTIPPPPGKGGLIELHNSWTVTKDLYSDALKYFADPASGESFWRELIALDTEKNSKAMHEIVKAYRAGMPQPWELRAFRDTNSHSPSGGIHYIEVIARFEIDSIHLQQVPFGLIEALIHREIMTPEARKDTQDALINWHGKKPAFAIIIER